MRYIENHKENELMEISKQVAGRSLKHRYSDDIQEEGAEKLTERKGTIIIGGRFLCITHYIFRFNYDTSFDQLGIYNMSNFLF